MIDQKRLRNCFNGQIGIRRALDLNLPVPDQVYLNPHSGFFLNSVHSLMSIENIWSVISEAGIIERPEGVTDNVVLNNYLSERMSDALVRLSNSIYTNKQLNNNAKTIFPDTKLYDSPGSVHDTIEKYNRFVGFRLKGKTQDISLLLKKLGTQFESENPDLKIYLYQQDLSQPLKIWTISSFKKYQLQWHDISESELTMIASESTYYLGYYESDLNGRAINKAISFIKPPCSCAPVEYNLWKKWNRYLYVQAFYIDSVNLNEDRTIWDIDNENLVDRYSWGLNLVTAATCDLTAVFCANKLLLIDALATQAAVLMIEEMAHTSRDNQQSKTLSQKAFYALDNKENKATGLYKSLEKKIEVVNLDLGLLNSECLPCQSAGITFGTIY